VQKRPVVAIAVQDDVTAIATVTAVGSTFGDVFGAV
jgi:hypothetical protein